MTPDDFGIPPAPPPAKPPTLPLATRRAALAGGRPRLGETATEARQRRTVDEALGQRAAVGTMVMFWMFLALLAVCCGAGGMLVVAAAWRAARWILQ